MLDFYIDAQNGKLIWPQKLRDRLAKYILKCGDAVYRVRIEHDRGDRNTDQNALYWKRHQVLANETGYSKEVLHEYAMEDCGYGEKHNIFGKEKFIRISSTNLTIDEFTKLMIWQSEKARFLNTSREPDQYIRMPAGLDKVTGQFVYEVNGV